MATMAEVKGSCIICSEEGKSSILKDDNFEAMLSIYWKGIGVDVKPDMNKGFSLCLPCYDAVLQFYQINDLLICFETKLREAQMNILRKNVKGIVAWQEKSLPLYPFMKEIMQEWSTKLEGGDSEGQQHLLAQYLVTHTKEDASKKTASKKGSNSKK